MLLFGLPSLWLYYLSKIFLFVVWLSAIVVCLSINPVGGIVFFPVAITIAIHDQLNFLHIGLGFTDSI